MTMPEGLAFGRPEASPAELAHSDLIGRLAREIYQQGQAASQPLAPTLPAGPQVPQALEGLPQGPGGAPVPSAATGIPSVPTGGQPSGLQPDASALAARSLVRLRGTGGRLDWDVEL